MLYKISKIIDKNDIDLYRDSRGFYINIKINQKDVDLTDVTFNQRKDIHHRCRKVDEKTLYIHKPSSRTTSINNPKIPKPINRKLSGNTSCETIFKEVKKAYAIALNDSGLSVTFICTHTHTEEKYQQENKNKMFQHNVH